MVYRGFSRSYKNKNDREMSRKLKFSKRSQGERRETSLRRSGKKLNHLFRLESKPKIENNFEKNLNRTGRRSSYIMNNSRDRRR